MVSRTECYKPTQQDGVLRLAERCVIVSRMVCYGQQNGVLWSARWCVLVARTVCYCQQEGVLWSAERCVLIRFSENPRCVSSRYKNYIADGWEAIISQRRIYYFWIFTAVVVYWFSFIWLRFISRLLIVRLSTYLVVSDDFFFSWHTMQWSWKRVRLCLDHPCHPHAWGDAAYERSWKC
jgi:hypothetical protein